MYAATTIASAPAFRPLTRRAAAPDAAASKALAALSAAYWVVGTMGLMTPQLLEQRSATSNSPVHYEHAGTRSAPADSPGDLQPPPAQDLARVREVLKPTVLELANLFGVSRQAVYLWQDGTQPSPEASARLAMLARAADVFANAGLAVDSQTLRRKVASGATVLDAVLSGRDAVRVALALVPTLKREAAQRAHLSPQLAGRKPGPADAADYGAPGLADGA